MQSLLERERSNERCGDWQRRADGHASSSSSSNARCEVYASLQCARGFLTHPLVASDTAGFVPYTCNTTCRFDWPATAFYLRSICYTALAYGPSSQVLNLHYQCRRAVFVNTGSTLWTFTVRFLVYFLRTATPSDKTILSLCVTGIQDLRVMQYSAVLSVSLMVTESTPNGDPVECRDGKFVVYCLAPLPCLLVMHNL